MAKEKKETAEQKLLKIIETTQDASSDSNQQGTGAQSPELKPSPQERAESVAASVKGAGISDFGLPLFLEPIFNLLKGQAPAGQSLKNIGLREVNKIGVVVAIISSLLCVITIYNGLRSAKANLSFNIQPAKAGDVISIIPQYASLLEYLDNIKQRNIFQPIEEDETQQNEESPIETTNIGNKIKDLKLVGVSWLDTSESASAMLEDEKSGNTYFIKQGETIRDVTVKKIYADQVILAYQGEETTLKL